MTDFNPNKQPRGLYERFKKLSTSKRVIIIVFMIWLIQAVPKWAVAITADGELSSRIIQLFITPAYLKSD